MGVDLEIYRARIGAWICRSASSRGSNEEAPTSQKLKKNYRRRYCTGSDENVWTDGHTSHIPKNYPSASYGTCAPRGHMLTLRTLLQMCGLGQLLSMVPVAGYVAGLEGYVAGQEGYVVDIGGVLLLKSGNVEENPGPLDPLDSQCSVEHMNTVAATCSFDWRVVGRRLVGEQTIRDIDREEQSEQRKRDKMFQRWLEMEGSKATYRVLIGVFEEVRNHQAAEAVKALVPPIAEGPTFTHKNILNAIKDVVEWKSLGIELGITPSKIKEIDINHRGQVANCRMALIMYWLESDVSSSWKKLIDVLSNIDHAVLADDIAATYLSKNKDVPHQNPSFPASPGMTTTDTKKLYAEAMRDGYVERKIIKCLVIGAAGVGKTTIKHLLLGEKPPEKRVSTGVLENPIRAVSISKAGYCNGSWVKVESDDELMKMIAEAIKSGKVPKERNNSGGHLAVGLQNDNENNSDGSVPVTQRDRDIGSSQVEPEYTSESIHTEFVAAINNTEGGERFLSAKWIHFIDSGGQPEFHDLLPLFIPNTSFVVFVFKLSESLQCKPKVEYFGSSGRIGDPYISYLTHKEILEHSLKTFHGSSGHTPMILVIGTHKDCEPKLEVEDLKHCLSHNKDSVIFFGDEPFVSINCMSKDDGEMEDVIEGIRSTILEAAESNESAKTPLAWFGLEMELKKASKTKAGVLTIEECKVGANKFSLFNDQFEAALQHLVEQNIFLHYPEILPDIVFCDPQVLFNEVTRIIQHHYKLKNSKKPRAGVMNRFVDNGYISIEIINQIIKKHDLEPELFLKLLSQLNIISAIHMNDFYLMPALLSNTENPDKTVISIPGKNTYPPLCITFGGGCAPNGLFCSLVAHLLHSQDWKLCMKRNTPSCCFHNCVAFVYCGQTVVTLMDLFSHFRVYVQTPETTCYLIKDIVHTSIDEVHKGSKLIFADAIICPSHPVKNHLALWLLNPNECYQCTDDNRISENIPAEYVCWKKPLTASIEMAPTDPLTDCATLYAHDEKPVLKKIHTLKIENWYGVGVELDMESHCLDEIIRNHPQDVNTQKVVMLKTWLNQDTNATYGKLARALLAVGEAPCAEQLAKNVGFTLSALNFGCDTPPQGAQVPGSQNL